MLRLTVLFSAPILSSFPHKVIGPAAAGVGIAVRIQGAAVFEAAAPKLCKALQKPECQNCQEEDWQEATCDLVLAVLQGLDVAPQVAPQVLRCSWGRE